MLELCPLGGGGNPGQNLQPLVHLKGIRRHGHGALPQLPQPSAELDRHLGLANAGGPKHRDDVSPHRPEYRGAMSVVARLTDRWESLR